MVRDARRCGAEDGIAGVGISGRRGRWTMSYCPGVVLEGRAGFFGCSADWLRRVLWTQIVWACLRAFPSVVVVETASTAACQRG